MADLPLQETASRIAVYAAGDGPCMCGQNRGHAGWLVCVLGPSASVSHPVSDSDDCECGTLRSNEYRGRDGWWRCFECDRRVEKVDG